MRLTGRDIQTIDLVFWAKALRGDQLQIGAGHSLTSPTRYQHRLTLLTSNQYLATLPRHVAEPAIYALNRHSRFGNRLMKERWGERAFRRQMGRRVEALEHLLAINDARVRIQRACADLGWTLTRWQSSADLSPVLKSQHLLPDGYCQISRLVGERTLTASFFLEVERISRDARVMCSKLTKYGELYYSGTYTELFGNKALRLLVLFAEGSEHAIRQRITRSVLEAARLEVTIAHFASLSQVKALPPTAILTAPVWQAPRADEPLSLFSAQAEAQHDVA